MQGSQRVIDCLNQILTNELTAINQYFLHARMCKDWGYHRLAEKIYKESIDEMKHAQELIDRILILKGIPNVQRLRAINIGENVTEILFSDRALEIDAIPALKESIQLCWDENDHVSREILEHILVSEEEHLDWLDTQVDIIKEIGKENYLAHNMHEEK